MSAARDADLKLLKSILDLAADEDFDLYHPIAPHATLQAFRQMRRELHLERYEELTAKQRRWAAGIWARLNGEEAPPEYENLISSGKAPRGKEVPTPAILQNLPKKPPRKAT